MNAMIVVAGLSLLAPTEEEHAGPLVGPIARLAPLLGSWEVRGRWEGGPVVWSRATYAAGIGGRCVEGRVLVKDGDGVPYQRYLSVYAYDAERDTLVAHTFHHDGSASTSDVAFEDGVLISVWTEGEAVFRDRSALLAGGRMRWTVDVGTSGSDEKRTIIDAEWRQLGKHAMPKPIDSNLFVAGEATSSFVVEGTIRAPVEAVYRAWTDGGAFAEAYGPDRGELRADIDLAIGGRYEWLWDGETGSNGCQILSFVPGRMVSFSWNAPPDQADSRAQRTWVVVELEPRDGATYVRLTHLGFGSAAHWAETKEYFAKAWPHVIAQFRTHLESGDAAR